MLILYSSLSTIYQPTNTIGRYANFIDSISQIRKATNDANSTETNSIVNFCSVYCFLLIPIFVYFTCKGIDNFRK